MVDRDLNTFAGPFVDRRSHRRRDDAWLQRKLAESTTRFVPLFGGRNFLRMKPAPSALLLTPSEARGFLESAADIVLLGRFREHVCFALDLGLNTGARSPDLGGGELHGLRTVGSLLAREESALLAYARAMVLWHHRHRFCGACGSRTRSVQAGHLRVCTGADCGHRLFPRIDPAIIVLVTHRERCLLGRQPSWPTGRYSTIAGFVEPGEDLEDAVAREVREETGLALSEVRYHSSQPWPFPSSLMLGFMAVARDTRIHLLDDELEDAQWFSREQIGTGTPRLPPPLSIAYRLIEAWYDSAARRPLTEILSQHPVEGVEPRS